MPIDRTLGDETVGGVGPRAAAAPRRDEIGRYVVLSTLGAGGMGVVYAAYDPRLDRKVALKVLHSGAFARPAGEGHHRLLREAQALAQLRHPNVITVHDVGEHEGQVFLAMEFIEGETLSAWTARKPPWARVRDVFAQAGAGLAAAHDGGLVHRDFKPDNVMLTLDGDAVTRVQVLDFGLARTAGGRESVESREVGLAPGTDALSSELTAAGSVMGTPAYMAPEQHLGLEVGPPADQFSFCVALYEGLYGRRPFEWMTAMELVGAVIGGEVVPPPRTTPVPRWLWPIVARGLLVEPAQRFATMRDLLAALAADPTRRRRVLGYTGAAVGLAGASLWGLSLDQDRRERACEDSAVAQSPWSVDRRERVRAAMLATDSALAPAAIDAALPWLDAWAEQWTDARRRVCVEANLGRAADTDRIERTQRCLAERHAEFDELALRFEAPDSLAIRRAVPAAAGLPRLENCEDPSYLRAIGSEAVDAREGAVSEARRALAKSRAQSLTGDAAGALESATAAMELAEQGGSPSLRAQVHVELGTALVAAGRYDQGHSELLAAVHLAGAHGISAVAADAATNLAQFVGDRSARPDEGLVWIGLAQMWLDAAGAADDDLRRANVLLAEVAIELRRGDFARAQALGTASYDVHVHVLGEEHPSTVDALGSIATALLKIGEPEQARPMLRKVLQWRRATLGNEHPLVAAALNNLAGTLEELADAPQAIALYEESVRIKERTLGPHHLSLATTLGNLGSLRDNSGDAKGARRDLERALEIQRRVLGPDHADVAYTLTRLADVALSEGDPKAALALAEEALTVQRAVHGPDHPEIAIALDGRAAARFALRDYAGALADYLFALRIEEASRPGSAQTGLLERQVAKLQRVSGNLAEAIEYYRRACERYASEGADLDLAATLNDLGYAYLQDGQLEQAREALERSLAVRGRPEDPKGASSLLLTRTNLASVDRELGELDRAEATLTEVLAALEALQGPAASRVGIALTSLAELRLVQGRGEEALSLSERVLTTVEQSGREFDRIDLAEAQYLLARALRATKGDEVRAAALAASARATYVEVGPGWKARVAAIDRRSLRRQ